MAKALYIHNDESSVPTFIDVEGYDHLKNLLGGNIEGLRVSKHISAYINEEGKFLYPPNLRATRICTILETGLHPLDTINGPMLLFGPVGPEGEDTSLTKEGFDSLFQVPGLELPPTDF